MKKADRNKGISRRGFSKGALFSIAGSAFASLFSSIALAGKTDKPLKIGIVGSGKIGGSVGVLWAKAGHEILFSSRHPENLGELVKQAGPTARAGYPKDAAEFGDVIFIAVPYHALPGVGEDLSDLIQGKIVIDCGNPYPSRDGDMAVEALEKGTGIASAEYLPGVRLVRAYNSISHESITTQAHREGALMGIPLAGNDEEAVKVASRLILESGFDPVYVGSLSRAREFDNRSPMYGKKGTAQELRDGFEL